VYTLYVHIEGLENTLLEVEELPAPTDVILVGRNPRRRDGKDVPYILSEVNTVIFPLSRVLFIEVMPSGEEDEIETFIRE
jgi:hypothetical protein